MSKVKIKVDGKEIFAEDWMTIMQALEANDIEIPHFCYHPALKVVATCRLCVVKIEGVPKLQTACSTKVSDGMVIWTDTDEVRRARADALEFLLINHPLDCPQCEKAGECKLQDYTFKYGKPESRFKEKKSDFGKWDISSKIMLRPNRCVLCTRCVRYIERVLKSGGLCVVERGGKAHITVYPEGGFEGDYTLNVTTLCPVGALISKDWAFKARPVYLKVASSICTLCSRGCSVFLDVKGIEPVRVRPRKNLKVNFYWLCDYGYLSFKEFQLSRRELYALERKNSGLIRAMPEKVIDGILEFIKKNPGEIGICLSPFLTNEELIAIKEFGEKMGISSFYFIPPEYVKEHENSWLLKPEKAPNMNGLKRIIPAIKNLLDAEERILIVLGWIMNDVSVPSRVEKVLLVSNRIPENLKERVELFIPEAGWAEKEGSWTNFDGMVQWLSSAVDPAGESIRILDLIIFISRNLGLNLPFSSIDGIIPLLKTYFPDADVEGEKRNAIRKIGVR